jgi:hypothetical protein
MLSAANSDWEHKQRSQPAGEVSDVPDAATVWACLERIDTEGVLTTVTIYTTGDEAYVTVDQDDEQLRAITIDDPPRSQNGKSKQFQTGDSAVDVETFKGLLAEYGSSRL